MAKNSLYTSILFLITLMLFSSGYSQIKEGSLGKQHAISFDLGVKMTYGAATFLNKNIKNDEYISQHLASNTNQLGGKIGVSYIGKYPSRYIFQLYTEISSGKINQHYAKVDYLTTGTQLYNKPISIESMDYALIFRSVYYFGKKKQLPFYFEGGNITSIPSSVKQYSKDFYDDAYPEGTTYDYANNYEKMFNRAVLGAGVYFPVFKFGVRFGYAYSNLLKDGAYPVDDGVFNNTLLNPLYEENYQTKYTATHLFSVQAAFEFNLNVFEFGRTTTGDRFREVFNVVLQKGYYW